MSQEKKKSSVRGHRIMLVRDLPSRNQAGAGVQIRVIEWVFDDKNYTADMGKYGYFPTSNGKTFNVKLEKRNYYTQNGELRTGKAEGWSLDDLAFLHPKWKEIIQLMKNPPQPPPLSAPPAAAKHEEIEEVPF